MVSSPTSASAATLSQAFSGSEWPTIDAVIDDTTSEHGEAWLVTIDVRPDLRWFEGHFPNNPVLPGVVQVHWTVEFARHLFGISGGFEKVENLKFKSVVFPDMRLEMRLRRDPGNGLVRFVLGNADTVYSEGRITFSP